MEPYRSQRRRQERVACDTCRRRKTRCDVATQHPCSICVRAGYICKNTAEGNIAPKRRRAPESKSRAGRSSDANQTPQRGSVHEAQPNREHYGQSNPSTIHDPSTASQHEVSPSQDPLYNVIGGEPVDEEASSRRPPAAYNDMDKTTDDLALCGLNRLFQQGLDSTELLVFNESDLLRLVYVGTSVSNLAHLVQLRRPRSPTLHYPHPPLKPPLPWKPDSVRTISGSLDLVGDAAHLPAQEVRDALVQAFFDKIHPGFPILDESAFMARYRDKSKPPPLLVLQAVLLAGAHVCDHPFVASSRMVVMRAIYRRASLLFHLRHENDRLHMVQAALLFTWHLEDADTVCGGSYYWLGIASRIAQGMGLHRNLSPQASSRLPQRERHLYRRIWWTLFQAEVFTCLEHGRPCTVSVTEMDQPQIDPQDFTEGDAQWINTKIRFDFCSRNAQLCLIALQIMNMSSPSAPAMSMPSIESIESALATFAFDLPSTLDFWSCELRIRYNLVLLHLHRGLSSVDLSSRDIDHSRSREIRTDASHAILSGIETMRNNGWLGQTSFTGVSALMAAAIQITNDAKMALGHGSAVLALSAQNRLGRLLDCARALAGYWPSAGALNTLFTDLSAEVKQLARDVQTSSSQDSQASGALDFGMGLDPMLESLNFTVPTDVEIDAWLNNGGFLQSGLG